MTYRPSWLAIPAFFALAACSAASGSDDEGVEAAGDGDGDASGDGDYYGDGDEVVLGTGGSASSASGGATSGDGDGDGDVTLGDGDTDGIGGDAAASGGQAGTGGEAAPAGDCEPDPSGDFVTEAETVFDERTCLTWQRSNTSGDPYAEAVAYCEGLILGGFDDWRLPNAGEVATLFHCEENIWPPIDGAVFNVMGDGIWTSHEYESGDAIKLCGAGQASGSFYPYGPDGAQNTRCVRGAESIPDRTDCMTNTSICQ